MLLFVQLFASKVLSWCKHDMGIRFVVKCGTTQKSVHPPLWQTCKMLPLRPWVLFSETNGSCVSLIVNLHQTTRLIFSTGICPTPMILTSFLYRQNASTAVHEKNTSIKYWRKAALIPQRTGTGAALAPRMKTRYIPIRARQRLMRICSCSFWRRFLK